VEARELQEDNDVCS